MANSPRVSVLGLGNWGTALANHIALKGIEVHAWAKSPETIDAINREHRNPRYLSNVTLSPNLIGVHNLDQALAADLIVLAFPSSALADMLPKIKGKTSAILISAIKGLEFNSRLTPLQFAGRELGEGARLSVLSGPSFARDVVQQFPAGVVAASPDEAVAREVAQLFTAPWMKVYLSTDTLGVELGGILKNVIAIAVGVCDGLGLGDSARAGLITRGLAEITRLAVAMGADMRTLSGLSGLGDLAMTATSDLSRNRTVGLRLGKGERLEDITRTLGSVAEGVRSTPLVLELAERYKVEMPISGQVARLLAHEITPQDTARNLLTRPMKKEFEG